LLTCLAAKVSRTHREIVDDYARMELWDSGNNNVWTLSISALYEHRESDR
jgi:hypothetical protein